MRQYIGKKRKWKEGRKKEHTDLERKKLYQKSYLRNLLIQPYVSFLSA